MNFRFIIAFGLFGLLTACDAPDDQQATNTPAVGEPEMVLPETISFNEHVQPVLSEYCYHCHGPDSGTRLPEEAPLRLDRVEDAFVARDDGHPVIIKGKPEESLLVKRIQSDDIDLVMPPPESHKTMPDYEVALLERWIEQGAEYEEHWAFGSIERPEVPETGSEWAVNPIDHFVESRLASHGLEPNGADDLRRYHRRLSLDLTGLPPSPEETDDFIKAAEENGEEAISAEADRLLATTASAEHFARLWLDAARYADTHGIHIDNYRAIWPYRDWVIRAFKANMPWDQFTKEQIAGDLLPDRTLDQQVASGFNRCMATTGEGGAIAEEYEAVYAKDQVDTVSAVWLGLTTGCASCHDHKFDPITQKDFYSMAAFFRNTTMHAMDRNNAIHPPSIFVPHLDDRDRWVVLEKDLDEQKASLNARKKAAEPEFNKWLAKADFKPYAEFDTSLELYLPLVGDGDLKGIVFGKSKEWKADVERVEGLIGKAPVITGESIDLGDLGNISRDSEITISTYIRIDGKPSGSVISRMDPKNNFRGWDLALQKGKLVLHVVDEWEDAESRAVAHSALEPGKWHHFAAIFDGSKSGHKAIAFQLNGKRLGAKTYPNTVGGLLENNVPLRLGSREGGDNALKGGEVALQDLRIYRRVLSFGERKSLSGTKAILAAINTPAKKRDKKQIQLLRDYHANHIDPQSIAIRKKYDVMRSEEKVIRDRGSMTLIMEEKEGEPFAHILTRGVYTDKAEKVTAAIPGFLPPMPDGAPSNRLGLAMWLNDPENPLPARVTMNRAWSYLFGKGIVKSSGDFGIMGARPSHPQLLDWLAAEFIDSGWDYREMVKLIVTSMAYRQSGHVNAEKLEKDVDNSLLSRGPRHRLDGEQIRDLALSASGLLVDRVGGPPVRPYQPEGIWHAVAMPQSNTRFYKQDDGEGLFRRSIYTIWKRTAPAPSMEIFNAPPREVFCVQRERTNTPLQALVLLNDPQFVEACRHLAWRSIDSASGFNDRLDYITLRLLNRVIDKYEREQIRKSHAGFLAEFQDQPEDAEKFLSVGTTPVPDGADLPELAAWTLIASQILNLDETVTR